MHKRSKRILIAMAVVVGLVGTAYAIALAMATSSLRQAYAALAKDGRPMNAADFVPPQIPDEQNGAPLYEKAASLLKAQQMGRKTMLEYMADRSSRFVAGSLDAEDLAEFRQLMAQQAVSSALDLVEQGTHRPRCQPKRDYKSDPLKDPAVLVDMWHLGRILAARAHAEMQANEADKAWSTALTELRLAMALANEPSYEGQWFHWLMARSSCATVQSLCETVPPDPNKGQAIEAMLSRFDPAAAVVHAIDADRLLKGEGFFNLPADQLRQVLRDNIPGGDNRLFVTVATFRPRFVADHAAYVRALHACTQWVMRPYSAQDPNAGDQIRRLASSRLLTDHLVGSAFRSKEFLYRVLADVQITRAGLGALQYKRDHGELPQGLEQVSLKGLVDPYTQRPLGYRVEAGGFVVYSVGEDLKDNGGMPRERDQKTDFDRVWRLSVAK
jgi:hypothetical protein